VTTPSREKLGSELLEVSLALQLLSPSDHLPRPPVVVLRLGAR